MNVGQLKNLLQGCDEELEVVIYADHGQCSTYANAADTLHMVRDTNDEMIPIEDNDVEGYPESFRVFEIS